MKTKKEFLNWFYGGFVSESQLSILNKINKIYPIYTINFMENVIGKFDEDYYFYQNPIEYFIVYSICKYINSDIDEYFYLVDELYQYINEDTINVKLIKEFSDEYHDKLNELLLKINNDTCDIPLFVKSN